MLGKLMEKEAVKNFLKRFGYHKSSMPDCVPEEPMLEKIFSIANIESKLHLSKNKLNINICFDPLLEHYYREAVKLIYDEENSYDVDIMKLLDLSESNSLVVNLTDGPYPTSVSYNIDNIKKLIYSKTIREIVIDKVTTNEKYTAKCPNELVSGLHIKVKCKVIFNTKDYAVRCGRLSNEKIPSKTL